VIVTLDGQRMEADFTSADTLQALIDRVRAEHLPDRLVVSVAVNGQLLLPEDLDARLSQPPAPQDRVDLESGDPRAIVADALRQAAEQLTAAGQAQQEVADQLNAGQVTEALERVGELVGVWQAGQQVVVRCCALLGEDLTAVEYGERPIRARSDRPTDTPAAPGMLRICASPSSSQTESVYPLWSVARERHRANSPFTRRPWTAILPLVIPQRPGPEGA